MSYQMNRKFSIAINPCQPVSFSLCESIQRVQYTIAKNGGCGLKQCYSAPTFRLVRLLYSFNLGTSVPSGALQGGWTFLDFAGKKGDGKNYPSLHSALLVSILINLHAPPSSN